MKLEAIAEVNLLDSDGHLREHLDFAGLALYSKRFDSSLVLYLAKGCSPCMSVLTCELHAQSRESFCKCPSLAWFYPTMSKVHEMRACLSA